jgi:hypothetical protein
MQNSMYYTNSGLASLPQYQGGGYIDQYGRQQYGLGKLVKKITKPIAKVLDKVVPNEIKPALPYLAAFAPFLYPGFAAGLGSMLGASGTIGGLSIPSMVGSGILKTAADLSQEGAAERGLNLGSLGATMLSAGLAAPGSFESITGGEILGNITPSFSGIDDLGQLGYNTSSAASKAFTAADAAKIAQSRLDIPVTQTLGNLDISGIDDLGQLGYANSISPQASVFDAFQSRIPPNSILEPPTTLQNAQNLVTSGLKTGAKFLEVPEGGVSFLNDPLGAAKSLATPAATTFTEQAYNAAVDANTKFLEQQALLGGEVRSNIQSQKDYIKSAMRLAGFNDNEIEGAILKFNFPSYAYGGRVGYESGGLMNLRVGGMPAEMDYRSKGGFVPIGKKERADDVPARLSKNEFVFTAKAVKNAGGGDIRKGAKRMYQIMNQLEAMA